MTSPSDTLNLTRVFSESEQTPQLRGIKVQIYWGEIETRDLGTGISTYDSSLVDGLVDGLRERLAPLDDKHLILGIMWREFQSDRGADRLLSNDLRDRTLYTADPDWQHMQYDHLWAYRMSNQAGTYGYNLKLWDPVVMARFEAFVSALAEHIDSHENLTMASTGESAIGNPVITFGAGEGEDLQLAGQHTFISLLRTHFPSCVTVAELNYTRSHVQEMASILASEGIGLGSPNSNYNPGLIATSDPPGVLTYYPGLSGVVPLVPEIQGDDYESSLGAGGPADHPSYESLYLRVRDDLHANYTVMQRNTPYWLGNNTTPSMLEFVQTYPDIVQDATGVGGLDPTLPSALQ